MLLGGLDERYRKMYEHAMDVAKKNLLYRPMSEGDQDILLSGSAHMDDGGKVILDPQGQHLTCFVGGMVGIGARSSGETSWKWPENWSMAASGRMKYAYRYHA